MVKHTVMLYSVLRQRARVSQVVIDVPSPTTATEMLDALVQACPMLAPYRSVMRLAVNHTYLSDHESVVAGDELAVITPVSGG